MDHITLPSGASLGLAPAKFADATKLSIVVARELKSVNIDLSELKDLKASLDLPLSEILGAVLQLYGSDQVHQAVMQCMGSCTYNMVKITAQTFEPESARPDFLPIAWEVTKRALTPLFRGLDFGSLTALPKKETDPESR